MLKFDWTFFVLLANGIIVYIAMYFLLFKPYTAIQAKRAESTTGFLDEARRMASERESIQSDMKAAISGAASNARAEFDAIRGEGVERQRSLMNEATTRATADIGTARAAIRDAAEKARTGLRADVEKFSDEIVRKLAGV